ncbi:MAG TPA: redoxin domain-containing protein [Deltaproteobacteria bacterium]|jgi:peroxiredoxin|nr:redoxin domain-containing protein [Deltaproteobacteria bacterium]HOI05680.1 redoxin domain-containing protein [Deltaproteobacteria bacterium]
MVKVGDVVRDFCLKDQHGREFMLSANAGKKVLLSFHPLAWTSVCALQMKSLEENVEAFDELGAVAVGISVDSTFCKNAWARELKIERTRLLSDFWPKGGLAIALGIFRGNEGISERANIIIDESGKASFVKVYPIPELPDISEVIAALKG